MIVSFEDKIVFIDGSPVEFEWQVLDAFEIDKKIVVLFDPDAYLLDPSYVERRRLGAKSIHNLCAFTPTGTKLWEAEFPEDADYYYHISSRTPLRADSFSSYECELDPDTGEILSKKFLK